MIISDNIDKITLEIEAAELALLILADLVQEDDRAVYLCRQIQRHLHLTKNSVLLL